MRYAIFSDIHANLEALEAVLERIDEIAKENPIDQIWFLGDLVGYGPNPNECIVTLRERTDVMIAGNHDWAAIGKIDLEDFSAAARISAEWTAQQLTEEHRNFLSDLPERLGIGDCTLVHGSPYGPLWEYLTSEMLAERSFKHFSSHYCLVGHTHVPVIFQQPITSLADEDDSFADAPTLPLASLGQNGTENGIEDGTDEDNDETVKLAVIPQVKAAEHAESAYAEQKNDQDLAEGEANTLVEPEMGNADQSPVAAGEIDSSMIEEMAQDVEDAPTTEDEASDKNENMVTEEDDAFPDPELEGNLPDLEGNPEEETAYIDALESDEEIGPELIIGSAEEQTNSEIEELLTLLGLTQSMIEVTNEMFAPPEGHWQAPEGYRFIINPGGVGQPRDGDPRAAFMIYDTERGFEFYRVPYKVEKTQEKIIKAGLPQYLAMRLAFGR